MSRITGGVPTPRTGVRDIVLPKSQIKARQLRPSASDFQKAFLDNDILMLRSSLISILVFNCSFPSRRFPPLPGGFYSRVLGNFMVSLPSSTNQRELLRMGKNKPHPEKESL